SGPPVLGDFAAQEGDAALQLVEAVHAVFDADPAVEALSLQFRENGIVVVESLADLAVAESLGVAHRSGFLATQVLKGTLGEVAVAGVHGDDAVRNATQQVQGIFPRKEAVAG